MSKNKLKFSIFLFFSLLMMAFTFSKVSALDYTASVTSINNLVYGNSVKSATIKGTSSIPGTFTFANNDLILSSVGEENFDVIFVPNDSNYEAKNFHVTSTISPRRVYVNFVSLIYKQYDGTLNINLPEYNYVGIINNEVEVEGIISATLVTAFPAENTEVLLSGITLKGEKSNNYFLDLDDYRATVYPSILEKGGENATVIELDKDVYVDVNYTLRILKEEKEERLGNKYTSFLKYDYKVYNHTGSPSEVHGKYKVSMLLDEEILKTERLELFELKNDGSFTPLKYRYDNGKIYFQIENDSSFVLAKRNIEYQFVISLGGVIVIAIVTTIVFYKKNSKDDKKMIRETEEK